MNEANQSAEAIFNAQKIYWQKVFPSDFRYEPEEWSAIVKEHLQHSGQQYPENFSHFMAILAAQSDNFTQHASSLLKAANTDDRQQTQHSFQKFSSQMQQQAEDTVANQWQLPEPLNTLFTVSVLKANPEVIQSLADSMKILFKLSPLGQQVTTEQIQQGIQYILDYQQALQAYLSQHSLIVQQAAKNLEKRLTEQTNRVSTPKQLHDLWVDCYEDAYTYRLKQDSYQKACGELSNTLISIKKYINTIYNLVFKTLGLVNQTELNLVLKQQHQLRKEIRKNQYRISELQQEISNLKQIAE